MLSDLQTEPFEPDAWARSLADRGIAVAVAATGQGEPNAPLRLLAQGLGVPFVHTDNLAGLGDVFVQFLQHARGDVLLRRPTAVRLAGPLFGLDVRAAPAAEAYLALAAVPAAEVLASTTDGDPLIGRWRLQAGRAVSFALPLDAPFNPAWRRLAGVPALLSRAVQWTAAPAGDARFDGRVERHGQGSQLVLDAAEPAGPMDNLDLSAELTTAARPPQPIPLPQVAPGQYAADLGDLGDAPAMLAVRRTPDGPVVWRTALAGRYPPEFSRLGIDLDSLADLARLTGGRIVSAAELPGRLQAVAQRAWQPLWPWLLAAAAGLGLLDWLTIRLTRRPTRPRG